MLVSLNVEKSQVANPGPLRESLLRLPQNPQLAGGGRKASGLNHCLGAPIITFPGRWGFTQRLTGVRLAPLFDGLSLTCGVIGNPDCMGPMLVPDTPLTAP